MAGGDDGASCACIGKPVCASGRLCMCGDGVGEGRVWELFAPSSQFCYKPKTVPPKGSLKKGGMMALSVCLSISSFSAQMVPLACLDVSSSSTLLDLQLSFLM